MPTGRVTHSTSTWPPKMPRFGCGSKTRQSLLWNPQWATLFMQALKRLDKTIECVGSGWDAVGRAIASDTHWQSLAIYLLSTVVKTCIEKGKIKRGQQWPFSRTVECLYRNLVWMSLYGVKMFPKGTEMNSVESKETRWSYAKPDGTRKMSIHLSLNGSRKEQKNIHFLLADQSCNYPP